MSTKVEFPPLADVSIRQILSDRLEFSFSSSVRFTQDIPSNYHVLEPDLARSGESTFGSPSTSTGDRLTCAGSSAYDSSTDSSSPISYTKELAAVASPLTPLSSCHERSKSKSPSCPPTSSLVSEHSKSKMDTAPTPDRGIFTSTNTDSLCGSGTKLNGVTKDSSTEDVDSTAKTRVTKKSSETSFRSLSPNISATDTCSSVSESEILQLTQEKEGTVENVEAGFSSSDAMNNSGKIQFKIKENPSLKKSASVAAAFQSDTPAKQSLPTLTPSPSPAKAKVMKMKLLLAGEPIGTKLLDYGMPSPGRGSVKTAKLVDYGDSGDESDEGEMKPCCSGSLTKSSPEKDIRPPSPRTIIGPLKPSKEPLVQPERPKMVEKRKSMGEQSVSSKRKRLLSERGEKEMAYPVMSRATTSLWNFKGFDPVREKFRGPGLNNTSNDCFLNAVLQCITHTAPLCRYIWERHPQETCHRGGFNQCLCCGMKTYHLKRVFTTNAPFTASWIRPYLRKIFPSHMHGQQEDAHELLALMLDALDPPPGHDKSLPNGISPSSKPSTPIEQIFGGTLRNQVTCASCRTPYINYERIRELNLAIRKKPDSASTRIPFLVENYFKDENLSSFDCKKCGRKTSATRCTRILRPPAVLIVQLKRFNAFGQKIRLPVSADMDLDLSRFLFDGPQGNSQYVLTSVVEHLGSGVDHGHYVAFCRGFNQEKWYQFDDEMVTTIRPDEVVDRNPYLLIYSRRTDLGASFVKNSPKPSMSFRPNGVVNRQNGNGYSSGSNGYYKNFNGNGPRTNFRPNLIQ